MKLDKLRDAEALFLHQYPGGFQDEALQKIVRKHNVGKLSEFAATALTRESFGNQAQVLRDIVKIVSRSSMVSMFEKPKFRDYVNGLSRHDRAHLANGFKRLLHGNQERGLNDVVDVLSDGKLAKWSIVTICLLQYHPQREVFVKPTTTKNVIRQFELENLVYHPRPNWEFYEGYRNAIEQMKAQVNPALSPNNAAFTGFLMMVSAVD
ncbi:MAG: hypothetical protein O7E57_05675 [Gammaproteobacteria bacterium]|nr:hypothetical protein [Gammaproteobacteria bacterium]